MKSPTESPLRLKDPLHEHAQDVLAQMRQSESTTYRRPETKLPKPFNGLWRQQIIQWMYTLVKHCKLRHEAAAGGAYFLDAAVAKGVIKTAGEYQLGALASLYLGLKMFDSPGMRVIKPSSLAKLGNANLTESDIFRMEMQIVRAMGWHLSPPTPNCFLQQYLVLLPIHNEVTRSLIEKRTFGIIESAVSKEDFFFMKPSLLGFCALLIGLDQHLEEQKTAPIPVNQISLWQLRSFLYHINNFANIDHTSAAVTNTVMLLAQSVKSAQYGASQQTLTTSATTTCIDGDTTQNDSDSKNFESSDHHAPFGSPTNVIL
jgi:Cyclin, N-terminal domain